MDTVLITGGTGHLGRALVAALKPSYQVRVLARSPGTDPDIQWVQGDLATGDGLTKAVAGTRTVVHAATLSPAAKRGYPVPADYWRSPPEVDVDGTQLLLDAAAQAGVSHFVYISIVGVGQPRGAYMRLKHTAEELVRVGNVPWSILRSTQFYWLLDRMLGKAAKLPLLPLPTSIHAQPVDSGDFATYVAECVKAGPGVEHPDFGGPEILALGEVVQQWQRVRGQMPKILSVPAPSRLARAADDLTAPTARRGSTTWSQWLEAHPAQE